MDHLTTGVLDAFFYDLALTVTVRKPGREYLTEWRAMMQRLYMSVTELILADPLPHLTGQVLRQYPPRLQCPQSLEDNCRGDNRAEDDGQHQPSTGLNDLQHLRTLP